MLLTHLFNVCLLPLNHELNEMGKELVLLTLFSQELTEVTRKHFQIGERTLDSQKKNTNV